MVGVFFSYSPFLMILNASEGSTALTHTIQGCPILATKAPTRAKPPNENKTVLPAQPWGDGTGRGVLHIVWPRFTDGLAGTEPKKPGYNEPFICANAFRGQYFETRSRLSPCSGVLLVKYVGNFRFTSGWGFGV